MAQESTNPFILRKKFPNVKSILKGGASSEGYQDYLFVVDANTLLAPYGVEKNSIDKIRSIYTKLLTSGQLYVPTHALLEFAENRTGKISDIFTLIDKALNSLPGWHGIDYPILHDLNSFQKLREFKKSFDTNKNEYKELLQSLKGEVVNWNWQDPISRMYAEIFKDEVFIDTTDTEDELLKELEARNGNNIPPGYKDKGKSENSAGDLLIWKSIIALGKAQNKDVVFVTNDAKPDWFVQGNKQAIVARFELVDEYYRETNGKKFACMSFSYFLEIQGAAPEVVNEVEDAAKREAIKTEPIIFFTTRYEQEHLFPKKHEQNPLTILAKIPGQVRYFLRGNSDDDDYFLNKDATTLIDQYLTGYEESKQYFSLDVTSQLEGIFIILNDIRATSYEIEYQWHRQKRSTEAQQLLLKHLCKRFLDFYSEFSKENSHLFYS